MGFRHSSLFFVSFILACGIWLEGGLGAIAPALSQVTPAVPSSLSETLPLQAHPLPSTLAQWQSENLEDYFTAVQPTDVGYLVWSDFPVKVYIEPMPEEAAGFERDRAQAWVASVTKAVQDWGIYLPLEIVSALDADIQIQRRSPPLQSIAGVSSALSRVRSAETRYQIFVDRGSSSRDSSNASEKALAILSHRFTIYLSPNQTAAYTEATARHELGHALGIWGHSPVQTDIMYFSQVRNSPPISHRDINTLKRVYQQPTRLGWSASE